jgi:hypothetical protein
MISKNDFVLNFEIKKNKENLILLECVVYGYQVLLMRLVNF